MNLIGFTTDLNTALRNCVNTFNGRVFSDSLIDEMTVQLNASADKVYAKYGISEVVHVNREFTNYLVETLMAKGTLNLITEGYTHLDDVTPTDPTAHSEALIDSMDRYDPTDYKTCGSEGDRFIGMTLAELNAEINKYTKEEVSTDKQEPSNYANSLPTDWGKKLVGNVDASYWAQQFKVLVDLRPEWIKDEGYLIGWFANAIMAGYDHAKHEEFPIQEKDDSDLIFVEFYDIAPDECEIIEATFKFQTLSAAKEFVKLNGFGTTFKSKYYRYYEFSPHISYKKTTIK